MVDDQSILSDAKISQPRTEDEIQEILKQQDRRRLSQFQISQLEANAKKNWDLFYKANTTKFYKDRHWTLREFPEILQQENLDVTETHGSEIVLLEAGCGVGNFLFPLLEEAPGLFVFACDFSPRAIDLVKSSPDYDDSRIRAFTCDLTEYNCFSPERLLMEKKAHFSSLIFVLGAISPAKQLNVIKNLSAAMKPGGIVFFRDYGRHDMAQLRFKAGKKIDENFYVRQDSTRSYYFTVEEVIGLFKQDNQFSCLECHYIYRRTINVKEEVDVGRIFVQGKFVKV